MAVVLHDPRLARVIMALRALVQAIGHAPDCTLLKERPCSCGKEERLRDAHGEACSALRDLGYL